MCSYLYQSTYIIVLRRYYCWVSFYFMVKSGESFVKIGSRLDLVWISLFWYFIEISSEPSPLILTAPLIWFYLSSEILLLLVFLFETFHKILNQFRKYCIRLLSELCNGTRRNIQRPFFKKKISLPPLSSWIGYRFEISEA